MGFNKPNNAISLELHVICNILLINITILFYYSKPLLYRKLIKQSLAIYVYRNWMLKEVLQCQFCCFIINLLSCELNLCKKTWWILETVNLNIWKPKDLSHPCVWKDFTFNVWKSSDIGVSLGYVWQFLLLLYTSHIYMLDNNYCYGLSGAADYIDRVLFIPGAALWLQSDSTLQW